MCTLNRCHQSFPERCQVPCHSLQRWIWKRWWFWEPKSRFGTDQDTIYQLYLVYSSIKMDDQSWRRTSLKFGGDLELQREFTSIYVPCIKAWSPKVISHSNMLINVCRLFPRLKRAPLRLPWAESLMNIAGFPEPFQSCCDDQSLGKDEWKPFIGVIFRCTRTLFWCSTTTKENQKLSLTNGRSLMPPYCFRLTKLNSFIKRTSFARETLDPHIDVYYWE